MAVPGASIDPVALPPPKMEGGKPLMQVLKERRSAREFSPQRLPPQVLSNLLWAAFGINRADTGHRTAPSASNRQEIDVYVATADGLFLYNAQAHALDPVLATDIRAATGRQAFVRDAPVNLVFVADFFRMGSGSAEDKILYSAADAGFISQNIYLYCASEGLATVVRGSIDRAALAAAVGLRADQRIILAQSVGYPK
jgi:SagB-type dehydrogenase family enzyme